jgi:steroid 5-alpha reductase family enzyme
MAFLFLRVLGVTLLETSLSDTKPGYRECIETTSACIPWFPKKREKAS